MAGIGVTWKLGAGAAVTAALWMGSTRALGEPATVAARATTKAAAPVTPKGTRAIRDLAYVEAGDPAQVLDLYLPEQRPAKPLPVVVWVHGGGWTGGSKAGCPAVGWVTSGGYAHWVRKSVAMAYVERGLAVAGAAFEVEILGCSCRAVVASEPLFDPSGLRMRT